MNQSSLSSNNTLFLGDLSKFCVEEDLSALFGQFGEILEIRIMRNSSTGKALSYGFIRFLQYDCAAAALSNLNGMPFHGRHLRIGWAAHNVKAPKIEESVVNSVYVRFSTPQIDVYITEETIHHVFDKYGSVTDVSIKQSTIDPRSGTQSGYGFVHFTADQDGVEAAIRVLTTLNNTAVEGVNYSVEPSKNLLKQLNEMNARKGFEQNGYGRQPSPTNAVSGSYYQPQKYAPAHAQGRQQHQAHHQGHHQAHHQVHQGQGWDQPYANHGAAPRPRQFGFPEDRPQGQDLYARPSYYAPAPVPQQAHHMGQYNAAPQVAYGGGYPVQQSPYSAAYAPVQPPQAYPGRRSPPTAAPLTSGAAAAVPDSDYYYSSRERSPSMPSAQSYGVSSGLHVTAPTDMLPAPPARHNRGFSLNAVDDLLGAPAAPLSSAPLLDGHYDFDPQSMAHSRPPMLNLLGMPGPAPYGYTDGFNGRPAHGESFDGSSPSVTSRDSMNSRYSGRPGAATPRTMENTPRGTPIGFPSAVPGNQLASQMERLGLDDGIANFQRPPLASAPSGAPHGYQANYSQAYTNTSNTRRPAGVTDLDVSYIGLNKSLSTASCDRAAPLSLSTTGTGVTDGESGFFNSNSTSFVNEPNSTPHARSGPGILLSPRHTLHRHGSAQSVMTDAADEAEAEDLVDDEFTFLSGSDACAPQGAAGKSAYPSVDTSFLLSPSGSGYGIDADAKLKMAQALDQADSAGADPAAGKPKSRQATLTQYFKASN